MSLLMQAMTSDDDKEIMDCVKLVLKASPLGLVHESINVNNIDDYTRSWFACTPKYSLKSIYQSFLRTSC